MMSMDNEFSLYIPYQAILDESKISFAHKMVEKASFMQREKH